MVSLLLELIILSATEGEAVRAPGVALGEEKELGLGWVWVLGGKELCIPALEETALLMV